jgi:hypothetical protein
LTGAQFRDGLKKRKGQNQKQDAGYRPEAANLGRPQFTQRAVVEAGLAQRGISPSLNDLVAFDAS